jgi:hypothetical protein
MPSDEHHSLKMAPCLEGYQSHYTVVVKRSVFQAFPIQEVADFNQKKQADELVVFGLPQSLPLFVIYLE